MPSLVKIVSKDEGRATEFISICLREDFKHAVLEIRKKFQIDCKEANINTNYLLNLMENGDIANDIYKLLSNLTISKSFADMVYEFVVLDSSHSYNDKSTFTTGNNQGITIEYEMINPLYYKLNVGPEAVFDDLKVAWKIIQEERKKRGTIVKPERRRKQQNFPIKFECYLKYKEGLTISEISNYIYKKYTKDLDYGNIKKIISEFNKTSKVKPQNRIKLKTKR
jgi:hypothetical protein